MDRVAPHLWNAVGMINIDQRWPLVPLALDALQAENGEWPARLLVAEGDHQAGISDTSGRGVRKLAANLMTAIVADIEVEDCKSFSELTGKVAVCAVITATTDNENDELVPKL